jgi:glucose-6-phosphate 1-dehydrogenase
MVATWLGSAGAAGVLDADPSFRPVRRRDGYLALEDMGLIGDPSQSPDSDQLRFGLEPEGLSLELTGTGPSVASNLVPLTLSADMEPPELPAYGRILLDVLRGNSAVSIRGDEAEEAWRVLTPVLEGWSRDLAPLEEYEAGSDGPGV